MGKGVVRKGVIGALLLVTSGCGWDVPLGRRLGSLDYPRADTRPAEHGIAGWTLILPGREASASAELGFTGTYNGDGSRLLEVFLGARKVWLRPRRQPEWSRFGAYAGLGLAYVRMRVETWDRALSDDDESFGGYICLGLTNVAGVIPVSIELRYAFATEFELPGGTMDADRVTFAVVIGLEYL